MMEYWLLEDKGSFFFGENQKKSFYSFSFRLYSEAVMMFWCYESLGRRFGKNQYMNIN